MTAGTESGSPATEEKVLRLLSDVIYRRAILDEGTFDRLAILSSLEDLAAWAKENPPPGSQVKLTGYPEFTARNTGGVEDLSITFTLRT